MVTIVLFAFAWLSPIIILPFAEVVKFTSTLAAELGETLLRQALYLIYVLSYR